MLTITHTAADGTLLEGSTKGDGAWEAIKAAQQRYTIRGWRYMPSIRMVGVSHSRDRAPLLGLIDRTADVLREAGFEVAIEIDGTPRAMEEAEADRAERMEDRAAALAGKAERKSGEADARWAAADALTENIPMGQPILVGHYSERGHRRVLARADAHMRKSVEAAKEAEVAADRARSAERHMEARNNPRRVYRRIRTLEADLRKAERELTPCRTSGRKLKPESEGRTLGCPACYREHTVGADLLYPEHGASTGRRREEVEGRVAHLTEQIGYWQRALEAAKESGADVPPDTTAIQKGYWVKYWGKWGEVKRVNKVSVTVIDSYDNPNNPEPRYFDRKVTLDDIREIRETSPFEPDPVVDLDAELAALNAADEAEAEEVPAPEPVQAATPEPDPMLEVLASAGATENTIHLAGVPGSREVFEKADQALRRLPGFSGYDSRQRAYTYRTDPRPALQALTGVEPIRPASGEHDKRLAYFATPERIATMMAMELGVKQGDRVLEPSAGDGALVAAVRAIHPGAYVLAVEVDDARSRLLNRRFRTAEQRDGWAVPSGHAVKIVAARFQDYAEDRSREQEDRHPDDRRPFDAVIMNPPFTEPGDRTAWATHFRLAWGLLKPGGRMVAILPNSYRFSDLSTARVVRGLVESSGGAVVDLPESTFAWVGTNVRTVMVCATKGVR